MLLKLTYYVVELLEDLYFVPAIPIVFVIPNIVFHGLAYVVKLFEYLCFAPGICILFCNSKYIIRWTCML